MRRATLLLTLLVSALCAAPAPAAEFYAVTPSGTQLVRFSSGALTTTAPITITGLAAGEKVAAIDMRPATGGLYGVVIGDDLVRVVRIDQATGAATGLGPGVAITPEPPSAGIDVAPITERIDVVTPTTSAMRSALPFGALTLRPGFPNPGAQDLTDVAYPPAADGLYFPFSVDIAADRLMYAGDIQSGGSALAASEPLGYTFGNLTSMDVAGDGGVWLYSRVVNTGTLYTVDYANGDASVWGIVTGAPLGIAVRLTGPIAFATSTSGVSEGDGTATVTVRREAPADSTARVAWTTVDDTATAGADFTAASGTITFAPGETVKTAAVPVTNDGAAEGPERLTLRLSSLEGVPAGPDATLVIADDDQPAQQQPPAQQPPGEQPPGTPPPAADTAAPVVLVLPLTLRSANRLVVPFAVTEGGPVTVTLRLSARDARRLKLRSAVLGTARLAARPGTNRATVTLSGATLRALRKRARLTGSAVIEAADAAGNRRSATARLTLRRR